MPLYEYECGKCGKRFERIEKFSDEPLTVHDECGGHVERLISSPALQFKGTGWYVTDYARKGTSSGDSGKSSSGDSAKSSSGDSKKSDSSGNTSSSKSETKSESSSSTKTESKPA